MQDKCARLGLLKVVHMPTTQPDYRPPRRGTRVAIVLLSLAALAAATVFYLTA